MSASDLVPRVVLFVTDLQRQYDELKSQLKEQEDKQLLVQITGPNGTPIYYEDSLKNGHSNGDRLWKLIFKNYYNGLVQIHLSPSSSFTDFEIWLGGIFIDNFQNVVRSIQIYMISPDSESRMGMGMGTVVISFHPHELTNRGRSPVSSINALIGPMTAADYDKLTDEQLDLEEPIAAHNNISFMIDSISFRTDKIKGSMALLQKLGIRTSDVDSDNNGDGDIDNDDDDDDHEDDDDDDNDDHDDHDDDDDDDDDGDDSANDSDEETSDDEEEDEN